MMFNVILVQRISEGALSPDGTVLATASHDGYVKFWQIYIEGQNQPRYMFKTDILRCTVYSQIPFRQIILLHFYSQVHFIANLALPFL